MTEIRREEGYSLLIAPNRSDVFSSLPEETSDNSLNQCWLIFSVNRSVRCQKMPNSQMSCFAVTDEEKKPQQYSHLRGWNLRITTPNWFISYQADCRLIKSSTAVTHFIIYSVRPVSSCFYRRSNCSSTTERGNFPLFAFLVFPVKFFRCANWKCV